MGRKFLIAVLILLAAGGAIFLTLKFTTPRVTVPESRLTKAEARLIIEAVAPFISKPRLFKVSDIKNRYDQKFFVENYNKSTFFLHRMDLNRNGIEDKIIIGKMSGFNNTFVLIVEEIGGKSVVRYYRSISADKGYLMLYQFNDENNLEKLAIGLTAGSNDLLSVYWDSKKKQYYLIYGDGADSTRFYSEDYTL